MLISFSSRWCTYVRVSSALTACCAAAFPFNLGGFASVDTLTLSHSLPRAVVYSYFTWTGENLMASRLAGTQGLLTYVISIETPGSYEVRDSAYDSASDSPTKPRAATRCVRGRSVAVLAGHLQPLARHHAVTR